ncbi:hypothetical protein FQP34_03420 [Peribacillus simplex]|uniref:Uncharacterized protein n=1 Tax=Peribacillus simplex TaxID=1478 RepID=A0A8B5Y570_9BACI|nr:hypothetical protein FQP34_03420 [Peribacillus simplex]
MERDFQKGDKVAVMLKNHAAYDKGAARAGQEKSTSYILSSFLCQPLVMTETPSLILKYIKKPN